MDIVPPKGFERFEYGGQASPGHLPIVIFGKPLQVDAGRIQHLA